MSLEVIRNFFLLLPLRDQHTLALKHLRLLLTIYPKSSTSGPQVRHSIYVKQSHPYGFRSSPKAILQRINRVKKISKDDPMYKGLPEEVLEKIHQNSASRSQIQQGDGQIFEETDEEPDKPWYNLLAINPPDTATAPRLRSLYHAIFKYHPDGFCTILQYYRDFGGDFEIFDRLRGLFGFDEPPRHSEGIVSTVF